jgi:hypothetical protein
MHSISADIFYASSVASIFVPSTTTASYVRNSIYVLCITTIRYLELENLMQKTTNYKLTVGESEQKLLLSMLKTFCQESDRRRYIVLLDASWTRW